LAEPRADRAEKRARATDQAILLRAVLDRREVRDVLVGVDEEEGVQQRDLGEVGREDANQRVAENVACRAARHVPVEPFAHRPRVPAVCSRRLPWRIEWDALRHPIEARDRDPEARELHRAERERRVAAIPARRTSIDEDVFPAAPGRIRADAELGRERIGAILARSEPRPTAIDRRTVGELLWEQSTADAIGG